MYKYLTFYNLYRSSEPESRTVNNTSTGSTTPKKKRKIRGELSKAEKTWHPQKFRPEWLKEKEFEGWLEEIVSDTCKCKCLACNVQLLCGKSELLKHANSKKHKHNVKDYKNTRSVDTFFTKQKQLEKQVEKVKRAEIKLAAVFADHNVSFLLIDHLMPVLRDMFDDSIVAQKMQLSRTKCTNIVKNVLAPEILKETVDYLKFTKFSILIDESTDIGLKKSLCLLVRYVTATTKVNTTLLELIDLDARDCSAKNVYNKFKQCLNEKNIPINNIIGFASDGAAVMIGSENSFKSRLEKDTDVLFTMQCICHSAALIASKACQKLPRTPENLLRNLSTYMSASAKRCAQFVEMQFFKVKNNKLLKLAATRWLCLHHCVTRVLDNWEVLKSLFLVAAVEDKLKQAESILSDLNNDCTKAYLLFLKHALHYFNTFNALFQSDKILIGDLSNESKKLFFQILRNFIKPELISVTVNCSNPDNFLQLENIYVGLECDTFLKTLPNHIENNVRKNCLEFYICASIEMKKRLPINNILFDMMSFIKPMFVLYQDKRNDTLSSLSLLGQKFSNYLDVVKLEIEWRNLPFMFNETEKKSFASLSIEEFWQRIGEAKNFNNELIAPNVYKLANFILILPHSNAESERIFSLVTDMKSKKRNKLSSETLNSICVVKSSFLANNTTCKTFQPNAGHLSLMTTNNLYK